MLSCEQYDNWRENIPESPMRYTFSGKSELLSRAMPFLSFMVLRNKYETNVVFCDLINSYYIIYDQSLSFFMNPPRCSYGDATVSQKSSVAFRLYKLKFVCGTAA